MSDASIAFIGGGNMATSLIGGLIHNGVPPENVWVSDPDESKLADAEAKYGVRTTGDNSLAVKRCATVVLAVKPQMMADVAAGLADAVRESAPLVVSIAAGIRAGDLARWLDSDAAIVRTMPNTPALVGEGATALWANPRVSPEQRARAESILQAVGITLWVDTEELLDSVTALSGSGPAYYFLLMEIMQATGERLGLDAESARRLTLQTALGAARIALASEEPAATLRARVTSPGGTTERAVNTMVEGGIEALVGKGIEAARTRSIELGDALGEK